MGESINYLPYLPTEPPEGLTKWLLETGALKREALIYRHSRRYLPLEDREEDCVEVVCSACGNKFHADKLPATGCRAGYAPAPFGWYNALTQEPVISGSPTMCPYCGEGMDTAHIGGMQNALTDEAWTATVHRLPIPGHTDRLLIVDWMTRKVIDKLGETSFYHHLWSAWVIEEKKIVRIKGNTRGLGGAVSMHRPEQRKKFLDEFEKAHRVWPWEPEILEGTTVENCKLDLYQAANGRRFVAYLGAFIKHPQIENLVMQGLGALVDEMLEQECSRSMYERRGGYPKLDKIDWKEKQPHKMLGLTKVELRELRAHNWGRKELEIAKWCKSNGIAGNLARDVERIRARGFYACERILQENGAALFWKIVRYLEKNGAEYVLLSDYWEMARKLHMDLEDEQVKWPKDLRTAHDKAVERYNAQKDAITSAAFEKRVEELKHLCWEQDGLLIRPCASMQELRNEGKVLHHCVATYDQKYATGKTAIFFIRRTDKPEEPFYTLELDEKELTVRQNRGLRNCGKTEEVQAFENAWIEWAKKQAKKNKRKVKAA